MDSVFNDHAEEKQEAVLEAVKSDVATAQAFKSVFESEDGAKVLKLMDKFCFVNHTTFLPDNRDAVIFHEGMRNVALWVHTWLEYGKAVKND